MGPTRMNRSMLLKFGTCSRIVQQIIKKVKAIWKIYENFKQKVSFDNTMGPPRFVTISKE